MPTFPRYLTPFLCLLLILFVGRTPAVSYLRGGSNYVFSPFRQAGVVSGQLVGGKLQFFKDILLLRQENVFLREQVRLANSQLAFCKPLEEENQALKKQLGVVRRDYAPQYVLTKVIGYSFGDQGTQIVLDQGSTSGIQAGNPVVSENFLVGRVGTVSSRSCVVKLLTDPEFSVAVSGQGAAGRIKGIAYGDYGTSLRLERVLNEPGLVSGELVFTSGEGNQFPSGLIVGQVERVYSRDADALKQATIRTMINISELRVVFVLTNGR